MSGDASNAAFAYEEPPIATVLNQTGFLVVLNLANFCLDKFLYCGLIGQLVVGILWGTPGAKWLDRETETVIQQLGYLGLIMLIYEGGLSTSIKAVRANYVASLCVALTGIAVPMALSFVLRELVGASSLQSFAAGASLSATSLGTTFTILSTTGLVTTRLGTITTSAAMLDDVVGLVMVQIISNIGGRSSSFDSITVVRPVFVSIGFAVGLYLLCSFGVKPVLNKVLAMRFKTPSFVGTMQFAFLYQTLILVGLVAGATYAGTSSLFAAYLAGVIVSWIDGIVGDSKMPDHPTDPLTSSSSSTRENSTHGHTERPLNMAFKEAPTGERVYEKYYKQPVIRILIPLFFASIGFAIPITEMFKGRVIWRGIIYALLMIFGKMITGIWLIRFSLSPVSNLVLGIRKFVSSIRLFCRPTKDRKQREEMRAKSERHPSKKGRRSPNDEAARNTNVSARNKNVMPSSDGRPGSQFELQDVQTTPPSRLIAVTAPPKPRSLYPSSILGLAMVARGEVGYLIASLAQSKGIFANGSSDGISEIYLVVVWAISICTLVGPICVGALVKRVKRLQTTRTANSSDPLGVWGI
ncbi:Sodium/hydrogen exchanger family-domain-containing protein [Penicillium atrosanguineum]|uniref:Sodium/hydrogen exchanger family-domain-containing protein n=1 Tax=Penicillium atrosanguineum TaxID=1132637 RepID=A0A9W9H9C5_9EURO|nr:uncharacterized protein N7443_002468 [Penicillium atrosanguineum]KAJ5122365.1 Sodium/hydrogen exchanger family-domain-containing protein [Penicillium atrosanguineum]KAJ5140091.1 Sodium/hydrogen exchanger family-domain-containing protein [Penicillium atrosanguineum]KAJ5310007.1 hypothetical protein N7443_002468 [Penicillium atrosanguineum]KAJ5315525.1 Sodium/hydrogen exchanger family-domain-containing protein [Penicillium atrosanguineum]